MGINIEIDGTAAQIAMATVSKDKTRPHLCGMWIIDGVIYATDGVAAVKIIDSVRTTEDGEKLPEQLWLSFASTLPQKAGTVIIEDDVAHAHTKSGSKLIGVNYNGDYTPPLFENLFSEHKNSPTGAVTINPDQLTKWKKAAGIMFLRLAFDGEYGHILVKGLGSDVTALFMPARV